MTRLLPSLFVLFAFLALLSPTLAQIEPVGHIGGPSGPLFVQGNLAFVGMGPRMLVMDISTPMTPTLIGQGPFFPSTIEDILVVEDLAYVIEGAGVRILDLSSLAQPRLIGFYPMAASRLVVSGNYLFVTDKQHGMRVLDVSNPATPTLAALYETVGSPTDLLFAGSYLYLVTSEGLEVLDSSTPTAPRRVGGYAAAGAVRVAQSGNTLYLITQQGSPGTLHVLDISAPTSPRRVTVYTIASSTREIALAGQRGYLVEAGGVRVLDLSDRAAPRFLADLSSEESVIDIAAVGNLLYLTKFYTGLHVLDMEQPETPRPLARYSSVAYPTNIELHGPYGYVPDGGGTLHVLELSNPASPQLAGRFESPGFPSGIAISGTLAYVAEARGLRILSLSIPQSPTEIGYYPIPTYSDGIEYPTGVALRGHLAYMTYLGCRSQVGCGFGGVRILDVSNPQVPRVLVSYGIGYAYDIAISGQYAYVATGDLHVLDLAAPLIPTLVGFYDAPGGPTGARGVEVVGEFAYVHHEGPGVVILNIEEPTEPVELDRYRYSAPAVAGGLDVTEGYLYLANPFGGVYVMEQRFYATGRVMDVHGAPVPGVTLVSSAGELRPPDASGHYTLSLSLPGSATLTASRSGYAFAPPVRRVTLPPSLSNQDFILVSAPVSLTLTPGVAFTLRYTDTQGLPTEVRFPANAVTQTTTIVLTPTVVTALPGMSWSGHAFELAAYQNGRLLPDFSFAAPVTVEIRYSDRDVSLIANEEALSLQRQTEASWAEAAQSCAPPSTYQRDPAGNSIAVAICRVGTFALFGLTHQLHLPMLRQ